MGKSAQQLADEQAAADRKWRRVGWVCIGAGLTVFWSAVVLTLGAAAVAGIALVSVAVIVGVACGR